MQIMDKSITVACGITFGVLSDCNENKVGFKIEGIQIIQNTKPALGRV